MRLRIQASIKQVKVGLHISMTVSITAITVHLTTVTSVFDLTTPNHQCVGDRTGILCGQCHSGLSLMLGSNRCASCSNYYLLLLPVFALAGIVLVAILMFLNLTVSVGTINGLLFYANMIKLNEAFFFSSGSVPVVSQFISWLNLA